MMFQFGFDDYSTLLMEVLVSAFSGTSFWVILVSLEERSVVPQWSPLELMIVSAFLYVWSLEKPRWIRVEVSLIGQ